MVASKEIKKLEKSRVRVSVTVNHEDVQKIYSDLVNEYAKSIQIKGFRKGKVPVTVLEAKYKEDFKADAMSRIIDQSIDEALENENIQVLSYGAPVLEGKPVLDLDSDFSFAIAFDVLPELDIRDWRGIEIEVDSCEVNDEDIARELETIRDRNSVVIEKEGSAVVEKNDIVTVNYCELNADDTPVPGTERQDFVFTVGLGYNIYKIDDDVVGMAKGDEKIITKTFPADYEFAEYAGSTKKIKATVTMVKGKELPELDDELAQDVSEKYKTLDDLKKAIREELETNIKRKIKGQKEQALLDILIERNPVELPESMVSLELAGRFRDLLSRTGKDEQSVEQVLAQAGRTKESLFSEWRPDSEKAIKTRLIIEHLMKKEKIETSDDLLEAEYVKISEGASMSPAEVKAQYESKGLVDRLKDHIKEDMLFEMLFEASKITVGKKAKYMDLFRENE